MGATASTKGILRPGQGRRHFALRRHAPAADLADVIERHWVVHWDLRGRPPFVQELLPHPCVNLAFESGRGTVHGIPEHRASRRLEGSGWALGTKFRPGAFRQFTAIGAADLVGRVVSVEEAFSAGDGAALTAAVNAQSPDLEPMIEAVEAFLRARRAPADPAGELLQEIVADMLVAPSGITVKEIARHYGMSTRALQRLFRSHVGVGPKWVLRRYRLQEAAERIAAGEVDDLASLALDLGYFDQAHFNRDFRSMVGRAPSEYARTCAAGARGA